MLASIVPPVAIRSSTTTINAIQLYFTLLVARENLSIAAQNLSHATKLHEVAIEKREMGIISKNDLLQMELNLLDARSAMTETESELRNARFRLATFLDLGDDLSEILTTVPEEIPEADISFEAAYAKALDNNKFAHTQARTMLEADYAVATARGEMRKINLFAQIGFTGTADEMGAAYGTLRDNQLVQVGIEIPLVDWGRRRGRVRVAESNREVTRSRLRQEARTFRQDIFMLVERYANQREQLRIARQADSIAARRYATNVETYLTGRLSTLDLNDSRVTKDQTRREYFNELYLYWLYYYQLRSLTLWDFATSSPIDADFDSLM